MNKIKIFGISNKKQLLILIAEKRKDFFENLEKWLYSALPKVNLWGVSTYDDDKDNYNRKKKLISKYTDFHEVYETSDFRMDLFFGKEKVFISIRTTPKNQEKLLNNFEEYWDFFEPKNKI